MISGAHNPLPAGPSTTYPGDVPLSTSHSPRASTGQKPQFPLTQQLLPLSVLLKQVRMMQSRTAVLKTARNYSNTVTAHVPVGTPLCADLPDSAAAEKEDYQPQEQFLGPFILTRQSGNCSLSEGDTKLLGPSLHTRGSHSLGGAHQLSVVRHAKPYPESLPQVSALHNYTPTQSSWNGKPQLSHLPEHRTLAVYCTQLYKPFPTVTCRYA